MAGCGDSVGGRAGSAGWWPGCCWSAGGAALAAQGTTTTTQAPGTSADKAKARAGALGRGAAWRHALGRRVLHGEVTVQTKEGVKTLVMAHGHVTTLSKDAIKVGEDAFVAGEKSGASTTARRVVSGVLARRGAGAAGGAGKATP